MDILKTIAAELRIKLSQAESAAKLIDEGCTVPFIARYRKEATGSMDDGQLRDFYDRLKYMRQLEDRKSEVARLISESAELTDELSCAIEKAATLQELDDIYRPYRPKRKTRASEAKRKGLEPLSESILAQSPDFNAAAAAENFISDEVPSADEAISGAMDIIAEKISDDAGIRKTVRTVFERTSVITTAKAVDDCAPYEMYADFSEKASVCAPHRILAINRAKEQGKIKFELSYDADMCLQAIYSEYVNFPETPSSSLVKAAAQDSFSRLIAPSAERELWASMFESACDSAVKTFKLNLKNLLMQPPVRGKVVLGFDPAYRTGCKIAVVSETGKVLDVGIVYPTPPQSKTEQAKKELTRLIKKHNISIVAIGNGTASKESEIFIANLIHSDFPELSYIMVSEAGASVYSASKLGAEEFPDYDVSLRSAVSIARRLEDPLAELVKIDPKSIGVGQYQHDMKPQKLSEALDGVIEDCVNSVGVDLNTASAPLLARVSGIKATLAKSIVDYREKNGAFTSRSELKKVPKMGEKTFTQCAGFIRVPGSKEPLDETAVHPESYKAARTLLSLIGCSAKNITVASTQTGVAELAGLRGLDKLSEEIGIGIPTLEDIIAELDKPGRDPRDKFAAPKLMRNIMSASDLTEGMILTGTVRNVADFGAFVDIGVHQDGLVHISQICKKFIRHPSEAVSIGDVVEVKILSVDKKTGRISLTMKF